MTELEEVERQIEWMVNNMPPFPPPWATKEMSYLLNRKKELMQLAEQAEQEPVAWMWRCKPYCDWPNWSVSIKRPVDSGCGDFPKTKGYEDIPLYAAPVRTKDLTDAHILVLWQETATPDAHRIERFARAVIAKDREKNVTPG